MLLLIFCIIVVTVGLSCCSQILNWAPPMLLLLFLCIASCYSHYMCFGEVLPPSTSPCKWQVGGSLCCCTHLAPRYPPLPFTSFGVVSVNVGLLCWLCHGEVLPPPIALCRWWNFSTIRNKRKKKNLSTCLFFNNYGNSSISLWKNIIFKTIF